MVSDAKGQSEDAWWLTVQCHQGARDQPHSPASGAPRDMHSHTWSTWCIYCCHPWAVGVEGEAKCIPTLIMISAGCGDIGIAQT